MSAKDPVSENDLPRYNSLTDLKAAHTGLLKTYKDDQDNEALLDEVETFVRTAAGTGAVLDSDNDRFGVQSLIDYWVTILYRGKRTPADATLVEFDPTLSPKLDDSLCPYRGLNAFQEDDKDLFFGRQRLLEVLLKKTTTTRLLFVVGPSGSGKSSLVLAGLVPALKSGRIAGSEHWRYIPALTPGQNPVKHLASVLAKTYQQSTEWVSQTVERMLADSSHLVKLVESFGSEPAVVVIDQFEEVFTLCNDDALRDAFIGNLLSLTSSEIRHQVILTLRTDYEVYLAYNSALMSLFEEGQVRVMPLSAAELRSAIEEPAKRIDLRFEEGVVDGLVKDILGEPEGLPLLQFTLLRLWESRENGRNRITLKEYRKLGGARRALALTADEFYNSLTDAKRITLERIMLRLALPSGTAEVLRNTAKRESLYFEDPNRVNDVLNGLAEKGLIRVTKGDEPKNDKIEVAHEALVRHWPTLVGWIEKQRVVMRQRLRLTSAAQQWLEHGRDEGGLLGGSLLTEALQYEALNDLEKEFVAASKAAVDREERLRDQERRKKATRQRQFVSVLTMLFIATLVAAGLAFWQARRAKEKATLAQNNYEEAVRQTEIAKQQQEQAQRQEQIARNSTVEMEKALVKATKAEALAKKESERAKTETRRAIEAQNDANTYNRLYLLELAKQQQELGLRKQRDEANANLKRERPEKAIELYLPLLQQYKATNDFRGQAETLSQLSSAYERLAERAERKRDKSEADKNHVEAVARYDAALKIYEDVLKKDVAAAGHGEVVLSILWEKAQFFRDHNKVAEAENTYLEALSLQEQALTGDTLRNEEAYDNIVENLIDLYRKQPAQKLETLYRRVLETKRKLHPANSREVYLLLREMANFYRGQKNFTQVEALYRESLQIVKDVMTKEKAEDEPILLEHLVDNLTDLARTYDETGEPAKAEDYYRQALEKQQKRVALGEGGEDVLANIKVALAETLKDQKKYAEALPYYDEDIKRYTGKKDFDTTNLTSSLEATADILQKQGELDKIQQRYRETLAAFSDNQTVKDAIAKSLMFQARIQYRIASQQTPQEALKYFLTAEDLINLAYAASPTVDNTATSSFGQALNTLLDKRFSDASQGDIVAEIENLFTQLLDMKERSIKTGGREAARSAESVVAGLERLYRNRDDKLRTFYPRALSIRKIAAGGTDNPAVYGLFNDFGKLSSRLGEYDQAKKNYKQALAIVERVFTPTDSSLVVDSLLNLASVYVAMKEYAEAEKLYVRAISNLEKSPKSKSEKMAEALERYAEVLRATARTADANKALQDARAIRSKSISSAKP